MFCGLFDETGSPIKLVKADELIVQCGHKHIQGLFPEDGAYWFIWDASNDPSDTRGSGFYCITVKHRPTFMDRGHRDISYADHSADYAHFDLEAELETYLDPTNDHPTMIAYVESIVREHVSYQEGAQHPIEGEGRFMIHTQSPRAIATELHLLTGMDATELSNRICRRKVTIFELSSAISEFLGYDAVDLKHTKCLAATVLPHHWLRLMLLQRMLGGETVAIQATI